MKTEQKKTIHKKAVAAGYKKPAATRKYAGTTSSIDPFLRAMVAGRTVSKKK